MDIPRAAGIVLGPGPPPRVLETLFAQSTAEPADPPREESFPRANPPNSMASASELSPDDDDDDDPPTKNSRGSRILLEQLSISSSTSTTWSSSSPPPPPPPQPATPPGTKPLSYPPSHLSLHLRVHNANIMTVAPRRPSSKLRNKTPLP